MQEFSKLDNINQLDATFIPNKFAIIFRLVLLSLNFSFQYFEHIKMAENLSNDNIIYNFEYKMRYLTHWAINFCNVYFVASIVRALLGMYTTKNNFFCSVFDQLLSQLSLIVTAIQFSISIGYWISVRQIIMENKILPYDDYLLWLSVD